MTTIIYKARAYRSGSGWAIEITDGLPDDVIGVTQAQRRDKVKQAARDVIAGLLELSAAEVTVEILFDA